MTTLWGVVTAIFYTPLYNALIFLIDILPGGSVGLAIIILTIIVKLLLFPLAKQATRTQMVLKRIAPEIDAIKNKFKEQQEQVAEMLKIYKSNGVHPLSGIIVLLIQLPIIIGLYAVFSKGGLPNIHQELLYSFVQIPHTVQMHFLGIFDLAQKSIVLALLTALSQFLLGYISFEAPVVNSKPGESLKDDIMRSLHIQTKYVMPVMFGFFAYILASAAALYLVTSNIFTLIQDFLVKRRIRAIEESK